MIDKCCEYVSQWIQTKETSRERKGVNEVFIWLGEIISLEYFLPFYSSCCRFRNNRSTFYSAFYIRILFLFSDMLNVALKNFCNIFFLRLFLNLQLPEETNVQRLSLISMHNPAYRWWEHSNISAKSCYLDLTANSHNWFTGKCVCS